MTTLPLIEAGGVHDVAQPPSKRTLTGGSCPPGAAAPPASLHINRGQVDRGAEDLLRVAALVVDVGGDDYDVSALRMDGDPWSKSRPRHTRTGRTYSLPEDRDAEVRTARRLATLRLEPMPGNVALACVFYRSSRQRIDTDNLLKHICDAANGVLWHDDSQVTAVVGVLELDPAHPRTVVAVAPHHSSLGRGVDWTNTCPMCDQAFVVDPKKSSKKYCGVNCAGRARGHVLQAHPVPCEHCGELFKRTTTAQKLCSAACRSALIRGRNKARASDRPFSVCLSCGVQLAHRRGGRCRSCWAADPHGREVAR